MSKRFRDYFVHEAVGPIAGATDYTSEGFTVLWSEGGLMIRPTDYHSTKLVFPWQEVLKMAEKEYGDLRAAAPRRPTSKGPRGKIFFIDEGLGLEWDEKCLSFQAIDYHATELTISWYQICELALATGQITTG